MRGAASSRKAGPGVKPGPGLSGLGAGWARGSEWGCKWGPGAGRSRGVARAGRVEVNKA